MKSIIWKLKKNRFNIICFIATIITYISIIGIFVKKSMNEYNMGQFRLIFFLGILVILLIFGIILFLRRNIKIEKQFLYLAIYFGLIFVVVIPPMQVPDEPVHTYRAFDLAKGRVLYERNDDSMMLPSGIKEYMDKIEFDRMKGQWWEEVDKGAFVDAMKIPLNKKELIKYEASATRAYLPFAYVPQAIGILIGSILNLPTFFVLLLGRLTNLAVWITMCYFAIKVMPIKKELLMLVMLIPMSIHQGASLSPDAILNSSSFLLIAYILHLRFREENVSARDYIIITLLTILIMSVKLPYAALAGLLLIVQSEKFGLKKHLMKIISIMCIGLFALGVFVGWTIISSSTNNIEESEITEQWSAVEEVETASYGEVIIAIVKDPIKFLEKVKFTFSEMKSYYKESLVAYFGWLDAKAPNILINLICLVIIVHMFVGSKNYKPLGTFNRILLVGFVLIMYGVLCMVSFQWNGANYDLVTYFKGIQGRYFIPFLMPGLIVGYNGTLILKKNILSKVEFGWVRPLYIAFTLCFSLTVILNRFWM